MEERANAKRFRWAESPEKNEETNKILSQDQEKQSSTERKNLLSLPTEILMEILSYLDNRDFYTLRKVSSRFELLEPSVWRTYEVLHCGPSTSEVIHQLKRLPLLSKIIIECRSDCDEILHQLSLTNKKLEQLWIKNCTGSTGALYLRSSHITRILERCPRLHTIYIEGARLRGRKFYKLLGEKGLKLRSLNSTVTASQFREFLHNAHHLNVNDRLAMDNMCVGCKTWSPLRYSVIPSYCRTVVKRYTALVTYLYATEYFPINNDEVN